MNKQYRYLIGIDTGTTTGIAVWDKAQKKLTGVEALKIHEAIVRVQILAQDNPGQVFVRVEDARKRQWFGKSDREKLQGAGSIKRDAVIWEDFLKDLQISFELVAPKNNKTKVS